MRCVSWCNGPHRSVCPAHRPKPPKRTGLYRHVLRYPYVCVCDACAVSVVFRAKRRRPPTSAPDRSNINQYACAIMIECDPGWASAYACVVGYISGSRNMRNRVSCGGAHHASPTPVVIIQRYGCHLRNAQQQRGFRPGAVQRPHPPPSPSPQDDEPHHVRVHITLLLSGVGIVCMRCCCRWQAMHMLLNG